MKKKKYIPGLQFWGSYLCWQFDVFVPNIVYA